MSEQGEPIASESNGLKHYLTPANMWALSIGGAIGWGAFVMPATTLLPKAGPVGTIIGMVIAALIMVLVAATFNFLLNRYPDSGGAFTFTHKVLGYDHAFLCGWALILAYISIMWANATAFILISRFLLGGMFQFGFHYVVAGYDVWAGEILVTLIILVSFGLFSISRKDAIRAVNTVLAFVMTFGVVACFIIVFVQTGGHLNLDPAFSPGTSPFVGVFGIVALAPWAFLGFESVAHGAGEAKFSLKKLFPIMVFGVVGGALIYILMTLVSIMGAPSRYPNWAAYIGDLGNLDGLAGLPTFNAMESALGQTGLALLGIVIVSAVSTSLITLYRASSRLLYSAAKEGILPRWFAVLSKDGIPRNAIIFIMIISIVVPFVGRAAIGWIVDVTSVSASIVYGYAALCCLKLAREEGNTAMQAVGVVSIAFATVFLVYPLVPNVWSISALASESYLILAAWAIVGLILFRLAFKRDKNNQFGHSTIVWILMIFLILFSSTMWMRQIMHDNMEDIVTDVSEYYTDVSASYGLLLSEEEQALEAQHLEAQTAGMRETLLNSSLIQMVLIVISLALMFNIYALMRKREKEHDVQRAAAEETSKAKTTFLSNMSHDIRTPMNAIIGYTHLARREGTTFEETQEYLEKIDGSSKHLLALINDILDMSRIESGKMELESVESDLRKTMDEVRDMFATQMKTKGITYTVDARDVVNGRVMADTSRLNRVLLNLISNAYKFTPEGGSVSVVLKQLGIPDERGFATYELRVKDSGIGMTPEFAAKVFEAFERERNTTVSGIQGTGLGMAITKSIIDLMGGTIDVVTAVGEGTEFVVKVSFETLAETPVSDSGSGADGESIEFAGKRILLVEDNEINREIATLILEDAGFVLEEAENGKVALDMVAASQPGYYDVVLMDVQMPVMNGYEATRAIRKLDNPELAGIPIVAASANAFAEDVKASLDAGMNAHVSKPLDVAKVMAVLADILR